MLPLVDALRNGIKPYTSYFAALTSHVSRAMPMRERRNHVTITFIFISNYTGYITGRRVKLNLLTYSSE